MTLHEQPLIVDIDEILDEQETPVAGRTGRQLALIAILTVVGLASVAVLATMLVPVVAEVTRVVVFFVRYLQGS